MNIKNTDLTGSFDDTKSANHFSEAPILMTTAATGDVMSAGSPTLSAGTTVQVGSPGGLQFNITYDSSVSSAPSGFTQAIAYVANYYASVFSDPITINLDVGWGEVGGQSLGGALATTRLHR